MNNYEETLVFLSKMEDAFFNYKWEAWVKNNKESYLYYENKILKIYEMRQFLREKYMNLGDDNYEN